MRILILQNHLDDDAAYLATFLRSRSVVFDLLHVGDGVTLPLTLDAYAGLAILGGPNSVNDDDPALRHLEQLIRDAASNDKPVIGHCLGGQLIATALGARVEKNEVPEVGWTSVSFGSDRDAHAWFGAAAGSTRRVFQWHYESFALPLGANALASSATCPRQAFVAGKMLAMQFHVEVDAAKLLRWSQVADLETAKFGGAESVQSGAAFAAEAALALDQSMALADSIYGRLIALTTQHLSD